VDARKRLKNFVNVQLRNRTDAALSFAGTNQLPNESLKDDAGRNLWSVGGSLIQKAAAIVIVVEITETKLGVDAPGDVKAEPAVGLDSDLGANVETANVCPYRYIKSLI